MSKERGYALVTGASQGLGRAIAMELARQGFGLVVTARTAAALEALCREAGALNGGRAHAVAVDLLAPDAVFRSPVAHTPYTGAPVVALILQTAEKVFSNFAYHRTLVSEDGCSVVLEFSADVGDKALKGIDMIRFGDDGKIVEFEVMVRPASGVQALGAAMGAQLTGRV